MITPQNNIGNTVVVEFPLRGEWLTVNTPAERVPSHGTNYFGQRYAYDFRRYVSHSPLPYSKGLWRHFAGRLKSEDCYSWGELVFAPFSGEVLAVGDGWADRVSLNLFPDLIRTRYFPRNATPEDYRPLTGNYILLKGAFGVALFAHLRCGSLRVAKGQMVVTGELLGEVGNSGNSSMPHLHFHVMDCGDPFKANGILCKFSKYERFRKGVWELVDNSIPNYNEAIRSIQGCS